MQIYSLGRGPEFRSLSSERNPDFTRIFSQTIFIPFSTKSQSKNADNRILDFRHQHRYHQHRCHQHRCHQHRCHQYRCHQCHHFLFFFFFSIFSQYNFKMAQKTFFLFSQKNLEPIFVDRKYISYFEHDQSSVDTGVIACPCPCHGFTKNPCPCPPTSEY